MCIYIYIYICVCMCIYTHTHTLYIYIYIYIYIYKPLPRCDHFPLDPTSLVLSTVHAHWHPVAPLLLVAKPLGYE